MSIPKIFNAFNLPPKGEFKYGQSLTQQEFADDCNINSMLEKQLKTGIIPVNQNYPMFGDFRKVTSYQEAQNQILQAQQDFMALPPSIRERFKNDPHNLIVFLEDKNNRDEAEKLGFLAKTKPDETLTTLKQIRDNLKPKSAEPAAKAQ